MTKHRFRHQCPVQGCRVIRECRLGPHDPLGDVETEHGVICPDHGYGVAMYTNIYRMVGMAETARQRERRIRAEARAA